MVEIIFKLCVTSNYLFNRPLSSLEAIKCFSYKSKIRDKGCRFNSAVLFEHKGKPIGNQMLFFFRQKWVHRQTKHFSGSFF